MNYSASLYYGRGVHHYGMIDVDIGCCCLSDLKNCYRSLLGDNQIYLLLLYRIVCYFYQKTSSICVVVALAMVIDCYGDNGDCCNDVFYYCLHCRCHHCSDSSNNYYDDAPMMNYCAPIAYSCPFLYHRLVAENRSCCIDHGCLVLVLATDEEAGRSTFVLNFSTVFSDGLFSISILLFAVNFCC